MLFHVSASDTIFATVELLKYHALSSTSCLEKKYRHHILDLSLSHSLSSLKKKNNNKINANMLCDAVHTEIAHIVTEVRKNLYITM